MNVTQKSLPLQTISKLSGSGACRNAAGMCQCRKEKDVFIISQYKNHNVTILSDLPKFWALRPKLCAKVAFYLGWPVSSAAIERLFSLAGVYFLTIIEN